MPKPRFAALDPAKQEKILRIAAEEFAAHDFAGASYNRILERCAVSKGAAYYYFKDKADLYVTVLREGARRYIEFLGQPRPVDSIEGYWREADRITLRSFAFYRTDPSVAGLVRTLARAGGAVPFPELRQVYRGWLLGWLERGQRLGAVRKDLPAELLLDIGLGLSETLELWMADNVEELDDSLAHSLVDCYRRVLAPAPPSVDHPTDLEDELELLGSGAPMPKRK
jgi:AcrR family transcriptional regulator